ncbi:MAG: alpha/beta fold hydrolase [Nocardioides sp.]
MGWASFLATLSVTATILAISSGSPAAGAHPTSVNAAHVRPMLAAAPVFDRRPCPEGVFPDRLRVRCGFVAVPQRHGRPDGRMIEVAAAVVPASSPGPSRSPLVFLDGGPSFGAISPFAMGTYFKGAAYTVDRDVVLVDTRGTGLSRPRLGCPEFDRALESAWYSRPYVDTTYAEDHRAALRACRDRLEGRGVDLSAYNSAQGAHDLDALRRALGYRRWNLHAISADGVLGLTYLRLHPRHIRSVVLDSPVAPQALANLDYKRGLVENLERVFAGCAANPSCDDRYPGLRERFYDLVHRLEEDPRAIRVPDFRPRGIRFVITGAVVFQDTLFGVFPGDRFSPDNIPGLLSVLWRISHGELRSVYREVLGTGPLTANANDFVAEGKTMSYVCHDVQAFVTKRDRRQAARDVPELAQQFLDPDGDLPFGPTGCRIWDVGRASAAQHRPVSSRIPTLVLAAEYDTGVPASIVRQVPPTLRNSFYYEFPAAPHLLLSGANPVRRCARSIAVDFLDHPSREPDAGCVASLPAYDFTPSGRRPTVPQRSDHTRLQLTGEIGVGAP